MRKFRQTLLPDHDGTRKLIHQMECRTGPYKIETSLMVPPTMYTALQFVKKKNPLHERQLLTKAIFSS